MKFRCILFFALVLAGPAWSQGYIAYNNHVPPIIEAPVFDTDCRTRLSGPAYEAQVYVGFEPLALQPLSRIVSFRAGPAAGYLEATSVEIPGTRQNQLVYTQLRVWEAAAGKTFEEAVAAGGKFGVANIVPMRVVYPPGTPPFPLGLESFCLIPEPSPFTLFGCVATVLGCVAGLRRWDGGAVGASMRAAGGGNSLRQRNGLEK